jgi:arginine-tRNA-protein transferase
MRARHPGGSMDNDDPEAYTRMIQASWSDTALYEYRLGDRLLAVAVVDQGPNFLSAVYTFYDPDAANRSPGVYAVLQEIEQARQSGRDWLYLGFWNPGTPKMRYKERYAPLEYFDGSRWKNSPPSLTVCND